MSGSAGKMRVQAALQKDEAGSAEQKALHPRGSRVEIYSKKLESATPRHCVCSENYWQNFRADGRMPCEELI